MFPLLSHMYMSWVGLYGCVTLDLSESLTKITEFLNFGATFDLDRIFSFFFHIEGRCQAPTSPKPSFWPLSQKWQSCPKLSYLIYSEFYPFLAP